LSYSLPIIRNFTLQLEKRYVREGINAKAQQYQAGGQVDALINDLIRKSDAPIQQVNEEE
jgi:hypothetical protein